MELYQYTRILLKRWWLILLLVGVGTTSAIYYVGQQPPIYRSTVTLLLSPAQNIESLLPTGNSDRTNELALTYARYLQTRTFAELVIEGEGLDIGAAALVNALSARVVDGTQFFEITATSNEAARAQQLATVIANNFIRANLAQQQEQIVARRSAGDVNNMQSLLQEKLERERQYHETQVASLREQIVRAQSQPASLARDERILVLQEQLTTYEDRLLSIMSDLISLQPTLNENLINAVTIIEPAQLPSQPVNSDGLQNILFAAAASLVVGFMLAFALEYLDYTVKGPDELEQLLGQPPLAILGQTQANSQKDGSDLVVLTQPRSPTAEAFRALRTNLRYSQVGQQLNSLVVTSARPEEGKTTVAANLALTLAYSGQQVILVDADLRRPTQHKRFGLPNHAGLSDLVLVDNPTFPEVLSQYLQTGPTPNLRILTSGPIPHNPAELLGTEWTGNILSSLEAEADIVVYDTPPGLTVTDAVILASRADATLMVVEAGTTRRDMVVKMRDVLERVGAHVLAPVMNRVKSGDVGYYYYYYYSGYSYGDDPQEGKRKRSRRRRSHQDPSVSLPALPAIEQVTDQP